MIFVGAPLGETAQHQLRQAIGDERISFGTIPSDAEAGGAWPDALLDCEVLVTWGSRVTPILVDRLPQLRWIHSLSAGVDTVPFARLRDRNILLSNSRGMHGRPIGEQIMGTLIAYTRGLHVFWQNQRDRRWDRHYPIDELTGKTLLIVGAGSIGQELARKAKAFDMMVIGVKMQKTSLRHFDVVYGMDELAEALPQADFVVILTPLTRQTYHFISAPQFAVMKSSAILLNYARGPVVDEDALVEALRTHQIRGAALDVFDEEPLPLDHPLWTLDGVLITPHTGGWSPHLDKRMVELFLANWTAYQRGETLPTAVNLDREY
ncbi:MAG: D-2-hydroxyacid dehydrogenase [Firmicutes bacterium]|nr:D-2-hydroxyacid dehydrogenase [Bacillota bacterium]